MQGRAYLNCRLRLGVAEGRVVGVGGSGAESSERPGLEGLPCSGEEFGLCPKCSRKPSMCCEQERDLI